MVFNRTLAKLSDNILLSRLHGLVKQEKQTTLSVLLHLAEVDRRDLYLGYGFSSLFDYCVGALGYSRSAAGRRIASARCLRRFPEVHTLLDSGEANLTTIGHIASIMNDENKDLLLSEIRGKTERQVESIVARYKPPGAYRDRVRPVRVVVPDLGQNTENRRNPLIFSSRTGSSDRSNCGIVDSAGNQGASPGRPGGDGTKGDCHAAGATSDGGNRVRIEQRLLIHFLAKKEFWAKLEEVKALLSNKIPGGTFEEVFEVLMNEFIDRHSPEKRTQRREKHKEQSKQSKQSKHAPKKQPQTSTPSSDAQKVSPQKRTRHIPASIRDKVFARDNTRCTYVGKNGQRCDSTHNLQVDHVKPFARGGPNTLSNLRLLCGKHNRYEAKRILGVDVMNQYTKRE